jgi:hypothetical protein
MELRKKNEKLKNCGMCKRAVSRPASHLSLLSRVGREGKRGREGAKGKEELSDNFNLPDRPAQDLALLYSRELHRI